MTEETRDENQPSADIEADGSVLPFPEAPFKGYIGRTVDESVPDHPQIQRPPKGAPNVVLVLLDDVGFGHPSTFGGPVAMPTLDRLARRGLRYNKDAHNGDVFADASGLVDWSKSPLRGYRRHHRLDHWGFPATRQCGRRSTACVAEVLRQHGYSTAALGKWHNTPQWECGPMGPFDHWPTGLGFEYFYGFHGSDTSQFNPALIENTKHVDAPRTPEQGYHLDEDLAEHAIHWVRTQQSAASGRPFFLYWAPGTSHAPHHAPK